MKKPISVLLGVVLVTLLTGCGEAYRQSLATALEALAAKIRNGVAPVEPPKAMLRLKLSFEDGRSGNLKVEFKTAQEHRIAQTFLDVAPGSTNVALTDLPDGDYYAYFSAPGHAQQWRRCNVAQGRIEPAELEVQLYRKRYVVLRYVFNAAGDRQFSGAGVMEGRVAATHWSNLPFFGEDWQVWQRSKDGGLFGETPFLEFHRIDRGNGFVKAPEGVAFDDLNEAPEDAPYACRNLIALKGLTLLCHVKGNSGHLGYGKITIEDITETPPPGLKVIESR